MTVSAKGIKGFLLYGMNHKYFFRVYDEKDKSKFKDYKLAFEDMEIIINDRFIHLYEEEGKEPRLDYSPEVLGKKNEI